MTEVAMPEGSNLTRNVSNSEVTAFLSCKRMYNYAFMLELAPKETSVPLARGTLGHAFFEHYIIARLNGDNHDMAMRAANAYGMGVLRSGEIGLDLFNETLFLFTRYQEFHQGWPEWKLLGTEERVDLTLTDTLSMAIRYDLLVEEVRSGRHLIGDFKFTYDFWSPEDHELNGQMPKYIGVLRLNQIKCDGGFLEEIRTRPLGKEKSSDHKNLWRRTSYVPRPERVKNLLRQHIAASLEIERHRALDPQTREDVSIPVLNKHGACKFCNFKDLCNSQLDGKKDLTAAISSGYTKNTYGYNKTEPDLKELENLI